MKPSPTNPVLRLLSASAGALLAISYAHAAEITKDAVANTNALNTTTAWVGEVVPTDTDVALWNSSITATNAADSQTLAAIGGSISWQGIKITNVAGTANQNGANSNVQIRNTGSSVLTLGSAGIDMSVATMALRIDTRITLADDQKWNVKNANANGSPFGMGNGEDLGLNAQGNGTPLNLGGKSLTLTGGGQITMTSGWTLSNGTLKVQNANTMLQGGFGRSSTIANTASVEVSNGSVFSLRCNNNSNVTNNAPISVSGTRSTLAIFIASTNSNVTSSGNISLSSNGTLSFEQSSTGSGPIEQSGNIDFSDNVNFLYSGANANATSGAIVSGNLTGSGNVSYKNTNTATNGNGQVRLSGDNSDFTGTFTLVGTSGNRSLRLNTATAGSASAIWDVAANNILQVDGVSVDLGTLNGAGSATNSHATNSATLNVGAGIFSGVISDGAAATALTKNTAGTLTLGGTNTYTGPTTVNGGTLAIGNGFSGSITSNVTVNNGGTLGGSGTITGTVTVKSGGTHNAGNSPGIQSITGNTTYESDSIFAWDINSNSPGTRGTDYDGVTVIGNLTVNSGAEFRVIQNADVDFADTFWSADREWSDIFSVSGTLTGWAANTPVAVYDTSNALQNVSSYGYFTITGSTLNWTAVPEPTRAGLFRAPKSLTH